MGIWLHAVSAPGVTLRKGGGLTVNGVVNANVTVLEPTVPVFTLQTKFTIGVDLNLNATDVQATLSWTGGSTSLFWSVVGSDWAGLITPLLTDALEYVALPAANAELGSFPIPTTPQIEIVKPSLSWSSNSMVIGSDFKLTVAS